MSPAARGRPGRPGESPRLVAWQLLRAVDERGAYANLALRALLRRSSLDARGRAQATDLAYGALRWRGVVDELLATASSRPWNRVDPPVRDALRLAGYQLLATATPPHAAVSAGVELARSVAGEGSARFANAVLRRLADRLATAGDDPAARLDAPPYDVDPVGHLARLDAHPRWVVEAFADALGGDLEAAARALAADNERPETHLVARPGRVERGVLLEQAHRAGLDAAAGPWSPYAVRLGGGDPASIPAVRAGDAAVQDEGSQLVVLALARAAVDGPALDGPALDGTALDGAAPDGSALDGAGRGRALWVDLCAGPGGKAALLAGLGAGAGARLLASELRGHRVELVRRALHGGPGFVVRADGRFPPLPPGSADRVLVDAPCTGLGALRRRPEARWTRSPADVARLRPLQRDLLAAALRLLRPGGVACYATCSPHVEETSTVVADVLTDRPDVESLDVAPLLPGVPDLAPTGPVQLWPHLHGTDAMFICLLRKVGR